MDREIQISLAVLLIANIFSTWYSSARRDGKITVDELRQLLSLLAAQDAGKAKEGDNA